MEKLENDPGLWVSREILELKGVDIDQQIVLAAISSFRDSNDLCYASSTDIAKRVGLPSKYATSLIKELSELKIIAIHKDQCEKKIHENKRGHQMKKKDLRCCGNCDSGLLRNVQFSPFDELICAYTAIATSDMPTVKPSSACGNWTHDGISFETRLEHHVESKSR